MLYPRAESFDDEFDPRYVEGSDYGSAHKYLKRFCVSMGITEKFRVLCPDLPIIQDDE